MNMYIIYNVMYWKCDTVEWKCMCFVGDSFCQRRAIRILCRISKYTNYQEGGDHCITGAIINIDSQREECH